MDENNISTKSQALERMLIEFKYMKNEITFLRSIISNSGVQQFTSPYTPSNATVTPPNQKDKVKDSIVDIFSNMPD